jgi:hypothetical protein
VEHVAIVVIVALLLSAAAVLLASSVRSSGPPPPVIGHVIRGLDAIPQPAQPVPDLGIDPQTRRPPVIGRVIRRVGRTVRRGGEVVVVGTGAFVAGFGHGMWNSFRFLLTDPTALLTGTGGLIAELVRDPVGFTTAQIDDAIRYVDRLRSMSPEAAYRTFMRDLGEVSGEVAVTGAKSLAQRALLRALKRRLDERARPDTPVKRP